MKLSELEAAALHLNDLYEQLEVKKYGRVWTTGELALGFVSIEGSRIPGKASAVVYREPRPDSPRGPL